MTVNYGRRFQWTKSPEEILVAHAEFKSPVGAALPQGCLVTLDTNAPGYLKVSAAGAEPKVGILLQNDVIEARAARTPAWDYEDRELCIPDHLSLFVELTRGLEFEVTNRAAKTTFGRTEGAVTTHTGVAFGNLVGWDGASKSWVVADSDNPALGQCTGVSANGKSITIAAL